MKNKRKRHFWEGMNKVSVCGYFSLVVVNGLIIYLYTSLIFALMGWVSSRVLGIDASIFSKHSLFVIAVVGIGVASIISILWFALKESRYIEKKQERGEKILL